MDESYLKLIHEPIATPLDGALSNNRKRVFILFIETESSSSSNTIEAQYWWLVLRLLALRIS